MPNMSPITPRPRPERGLLPDAFIAATTHDPAAGVPGMARNFGREVLPHIFSVAGRVGSVSHTYPWYDEALRDSRTNANAMRKNALIMECLEARQRGTALLKWHVEPRDSKDAAAKELGTKVSALLEETWDFLELRRNLLEALWFGRSLTSHRFNFRNVGGEQRQVITHWTPRHGDKIVFRFDDGSGRYNEEQVGIRLSGGWRWDQQETDYRGFERHKIEVSTQFGLVYWLDQYEREMVGLHRHLIEDGEYYDPRDMGRVNGVGIRDRIYWVWYAMQECLSNALDFVERNAHGIEIWRYPAGNPTAEAKTIEAAQNRSNKAVLLVPVQPGELADLQSVEVIEPGFAGLDSLMRIIQEYFGGQIKRYILGQTLTSEVGSTGMGSGVADAHLATFADIIRFDAIKLEETITRDIVRQLQLFNFPDSHGTKLLFRLDTEAEDMSEKLQALQAAWTMGAKIPALDLLSLIGGRMPDQDEEVLVNPAIAQAQQQLQMGQQQMEMQAQQAAMGPGMAGQPGQPGGQRQPSTTTTFPPQGAGEQVDMQKPGEPAKYAQPTEAQRAAGNYEMRHLYWHGLRISIETDKGQRRRPTWPKLPADYGYIRGTTGADGDRLDCFVGRQLDSELVFVVDQTGPSGRTFDEHKVLLGFTNRQDAEQCYRQAYDDGRVPGDVTALTIDQFLSWLGEGDPQSRVALQVSKYAQSEWEESKHPRASDGEFTSKGQGVAKKSQGPASDAPDEPARRPPDHMAHEREMPEMDELVTPYQPPPKWKVATAAVAVAAIGAAGLTAYKWCPQLVTSIMESPLFTAEVENPTRFQKLLRSHFAQDLVGMVALAVSQRLVALAQEHGEKLTLKLGKEAHALGASSVAKALKAFQEMQDGEEQTLLFKSRPGVTIPIQHQAEVVEATLGAMFGAANVQVEEPLEYDAPISVHVKKVAFEDIDPDDDYSDVPASLGHVDDSPEEPLEPAEYDDVLHSLGMQDKAHEEAHDGAHEPDDFADLDEALSDMPHETSADDPPVQFAVREKPAPTKTVKAYKQFRTLKSQPGKLFPLFIGNKEDTPVGQWLDAEHIPTKGYAPRPGWHAGVLPIAPHLRSKENKIQSGRVWAEVEIPADKPWQHIADTAATKDIQDRIPEDGHYRFKTNKMQGGAWLIGGALKVNRVLADHDIRHILHEAGFPPDEIERELIANATPTPKAHRKGSA